VIGNNLESVEGIGEGSDLWGKGTSIKSIPNDNLEGMDVFSAQEVKKEIRSKLRTPFNTGKTGKKIPSNDKKLRS